MSFILGSTGPAGANPEAAVRLEDGVCVTIGAPTGAATGAATGATTGVGATTGAGAATGAATGVGAATRATGVGVATGATTGATGVGASLAPIDFTPFGNTAALDGDNVQVLPSVEVSTPVDELKYHFDPDHAAGVLDRVKPDIEDLDHCIAFVEYMIALLVCANHWLPFEHTDHIRSPVKIGEISACFQVMPSEE
jgi:hypothetical protein